MSIAIDVKPPTPRVTETPPVKNDDSLSMRTWKVFENMASKVSVGGVDLVGLVTTNWKAIPSLLVVAFAITTIVYAIIFFPSHPYTSVFLITVSGLLISYVRHCMDLQSLSSQIEVLKTNNIELKSEITDLKATNTDLKATNTDFEKTYVKYEKNAHQYELSLTKAVALEAQIEQSVKLLKKHEEAYGNLNNDHRELLDDTRRVMTVALESQLSALGKPRSNRISVL